MCLIFVVRGIRRKFFMPNFSQTTVYKIFCSTKTHSNADALSHLPVNYPKESVSIFPETNSAASLWLRLQINYLVPFLENMNF